MRFLYRCASFPLENIWQNRQISRETPYRSVMRSPDGRIEMNQTLSNAALGLAAVALKAWAAVTNTCRMMLAEQTKPYQPELHYMRGPGPKWREKHACQHDSPER